MKTRKMISVSSHTSPLALVCSLVLIACLSLTSHAQDENPQRGFYPGGSYGISDIEKFNNVNGNLILNIPIAGLPPGRAGMSAGVNLIYNSKLWDTSAEQFPNCVNQLVTQHFLYESPRGGWKYGFQYQPEILNTTTDGVNIKNHIEMAFPDGSVHVLRPQGYTGPDDPTGYYGAAYQNTIWYSTDGSYFRVQFGSGSDFYNTPWAIYFSDGSRVTGGNAPQRIYDRNNNYVEVQNITWNDHPATKIVDQLDRYIIIENAASFNVLDNPGQDYIHLWGAGGQQITWTIKWKTVVANKTYRTISQSDACDVDGLFAYLLVIDQIILPSQAGSLSYTFGYNAPNYPVSPPVPSYGYGEVSSVTLPTGAQASYSYSRDGDNNLWYKQVLQNRATGKTLSYQREYDGSSTQVTESWGPGDVRSPDGGVLQESFYPLEGGDFWKRGLVYKSERPDGTVIERIWQPNAPYPASNVNPYVKTEFTSVRNASGTLVQTAIKDFSYDKNGNVTQVAEYDWTPYVSVPRDGSGNPTGIPGGLGPKRIIVNTYYSPTPDASDSTTDDPNVYHKATSPNLRNTIASKEVRAQTLTVDRAFARTEFFYDNALTTGNLIEQKSWDSTKGAVTTPLTQANSISVSHQYDTYGNLTLATDAKGVQAQFIYDPINDHGNLYVTQTKVAAGTSVQRWTIRAYDFNTGLVTQSTDVDNNVTNQTVYDAFGRSTIVKEAVGTPTERWTRTEYNDQDRRVVVRSALDATDDRKLVGVRHYDQLGRVRLTRQLENSNDDVTNESLGIKVQTRYYAGDVNNPDPAYQSAYQAASNPYRAATSGAVGSGENVLPMGWARMKFDKGKRVVETRTFDANLPQPWGTGSTSTGAVITEYNGEIATVTDQAGKKRRSQTDGLGRLITIVEDPDSMNYQTSYNYDALDNLRRVIQGAQDRWFAYDSLSRLIRAKNPEQAVNADPNMSYIDPVTAHNGWAIAYSYDANGNLVSKTDANNTTTTYTYDALNRNETVNYSNTAVNPDITRFYDGATKGKGRLWLDYAGGNQTDGQEVEHHAIDSYDALGRPLDKRQHFKKNGVWSSAYSVSYSYDLAGNIKRMIYPSGREVNYSYDQAGRLSSFDGSLGGSPKTYADTFSYNAAGQMSKERFGTNTSLYHNLHYNNRMQLCDIRVGETTYEWDLSRGAIAFFYGTTAIASGNMFANDTDNNGNLRRQLTTVPLASSGYVIPQQDDYTYDALNRISSFTEAQQDSGGQWTPNVASQNFSYDSYGNRKVTSASGGVSNYNPNYDTVNNTNRITGLGYDAAGNITSDSMTGGTMTYDAENRLATAINGGVGGSYTYDANGSRVRRLTGAQETWQVYGIGGELLAEYAAQGAQSVPLKEYGYRGGQLLIIAESGSGGGTSFVKPALKSSHDIGRQAGSGMDGKVYGPLVVDEPVAEMEFNEDSGSKTARVSNRNNTETFMRDGIRTTAEEYGNTVSANVIGRGLLAEHPASAGPSAPKKEYGRSGSSIVTVTPQSVSSVNPGANQTPDPGQSGSLAVSGILNNGHGSTSVDASAMDIQTDPSQNITQRKSARWSSFQGGPSVGIIGLKLKFDWTASGNVDAFVNVSNSASARIDFDVDYSLDGGLSWMNALSRSRLASQSGQGSKTDSINSDGGSVEIVLSPSQNISLVQVRDSMRANATANASNSLHAYAESNATISTSVSSIRLEVEVDTTPPLISNVAAGGITASSATITWATNENSDSQLEYGPTQAYGQATTLNPALVTSHSQALSGLNSDMLYHYRVKSRDAAGNLAMSEDFTFRTPDITAPVISNVTVGEHQHYFYGATQTLQVNAGDRLYAYVYLDPANLPSTVMLQWNDGTWEHRAYWGANNIPWGTDGADSKRYMGALPAAGGWVRLEVQASSVGLEGKTLNGMAFTLCGGRANWDNAGKTNGSGDTVWVDDTLPAGASMGSDGGDSWTWVSHSPSPFSGAVSTQSNIVVGGVTATGATITWSTNENADSQVEYGPTTSYGQTTTLDPTLVTAHSQPLSGLTPGTLYYYRVKSRDAAGNLATSAEFTFTTGSGDTTAPVISSVAAGGITNTGATITWTTNENSDSQVAYGPTQAYGQTTTLNSRQVTLHSQVLAGLTPGTPYYYRVKSRDAAGNLATSAEFTFTTAQSGSVAIKWLVTDHLGSTRMVIDETGSLAGIRRHDFAPFGEELFAGSIRSAGNNGYGGDSVRQKFGSYERDNETELDYAMARYYNSTMGRFNSVDPVALTPKRLIDPQLLNLFVYTRNNPLKFVDPDGEDIHVVDKDGKRLFTLDDGQRAITQQTTKQIYDRGIQWFEPEADNYMALKSIDPNLNNHQGVKHFTWGDIANFATEDRWMASYRSGGSGDWKQSAKGADGYLLVTVNGQPYWADAIGQIPFAVNSATDSLKMSGDPDKAITNTVIGGQAHSKGQLVGGTPDTSNHYDNYFVLRGAMWATKAFSVQKNPVGSFGDNYKLNQTSYSPVRLADPINRGQAEKYGVRK
jgi:RHS repeat-associated protein